VRLDAFFEIFGDFLFLLTRKTELVHGLGELAHRFAELRANVLEKFHGSEFYTTLAHANIPKEYTVDKRWLLGGLLVATGVGLVAAATRRPRVTPESRVLLFGDSMAVGLDPHMRALATETGVEDYLGHGIVGTRIDQWDKSPWLDETLQSFRPTLILVSLGTNDEALGQGAALRQEPYLDDLLEKLESTGADVVWIGPPELPFPRAGVSDLARDKAPYYFRSELLDIPRSPDGLHPNAAGYAGWSGNIWRWLS